MTTTTSTTGADVVADVLRQLGVRHAFGLPGIHMLSLWQALRDSDLAAVPLRTELDAAYAADGAARIAGEPVALLLSSGPGALNALAGLMEAAATHSPVIAIVGQVDRPFIGAERGVLHELREQIASFRPIVKQAWSVGEPEDLGPMVHAAWQAARTAPGGPVFVEVPADVLAGAAAPWTAPAPRPPEQLVPPAAQLEAAAAALAAAERPLLWAGTGVVRGQATAALRELAERLDAPVVATPSARDVLPHDHPLATGGAAHEAATLALLADADVVVAAGTRLGADATGDFGLELSGTLIQIDVDGARIGRAFAGALPVVGDVAVALPQLAARLPARPAGAGAARARGVRDAVAARVAAEESGPEPALVAALRAALPDDAVDAWDSTILGYWGAGYFPARTPGRFLYPSGSGTIGFAFPAALGAAAVRPDLPVLAVSGDGGFQYGIAELAAARQHGLAVKLVLVDDGGYGILREYQQARFGVLTATDMDEPDFVAVAQAFRVPARRASVATFADDARWLMAQEGPAVIVLEETLSCYVFDEGGDQ
ncbi:thiamine pyrophosphate-binding protein [Patulibacter defluvii]|uniref:thiamine pyrophosphate-binding protein n=1 Tax=Patulibacter defluvii TaxID=3095358 RepID=UPI002A7649B7|nr:thiamine pyrophosphate-binding protein [Patulibacter sp. DM4]